MKIKKFYQKNPYLLVYSFFYIMLGIFLSVLFVVFFILEIAKITDTKGMAGSLIALPFTSYFIYSIIDYDRSYSILIEPSKLWTEGDKVSIETKTFQHKCEIFFADIKSIKIIETDGWIDDFGNKKPRSSMFNHFMSNDYGGCLYRFFEIETVNKEIKRIKLFYFSDKQIVEILKEILGGIKNNNNTIYDGRTCEQIFTEDLHEKNSLLPF